MDARFVVRLNFVVMMLCLSSLAAWGEEFFQHQKLDEARSAVEGEEKALRAISAFWTERAAFKRKNFQSSLRNFKAKRNALEDSYKSKNLTLIESRVSELDEAIKNYKEQLKHYKDSSDKYYTLFNLAVAFSKKATFLVDPEKAKEARNAAISCFETIHQETKGQELWEEASYLAAQLASDVNNTALRRRMLKAIYEFNGNSEFSLKGSRDYGDLLFEGGEFEEAHKAFLLAQLKLVFAPDFRRDEEARLIYYRLAWSSYRTSSFTEVENYVWKYLGEEYDAELFRGDLTADLLSLLSDIYAEEYSGEKILAALTVKKELFVSELANSVLSALIDRQDSEKMKKLLPFFSQKLSYTLHYPHVLDLLAHGYHILKDPIHEREQLAILAMLLDENHVYYNRYSEFGDEISFARKVARNAAEYLGFYHYRTGVGLEDRYHLDRARMYLGLLQKTSSESSAKIWAMIFAKSLYFSGDLRLSQNEFISVREKYSLSNQEISEVLSYQIAISDKLIRQNYAQESSNEGIAISEDRPGEADKNFMLECAEFMFQKSDQKNLVVESLLLSASTMRDSNNFAEAIVLWRKVLALTPARSFSRQIAVRGIVYARVKMGNMFDTLLDVKEFLRLEDFGAEQLSLRHELASILQSTVLQHEERLKDAGEYEEAAEFLEKHALEFPEDLDAEILLHSAAVYYGVQLAWSKVITVTENYEKLGLTEYAAEMVFLRAEAYERLLDIEQAQENYLAVLRKYPKFNRINDCIKKLDLWLTKDGDKVALGDYLMLRSSYAATKARYFEDLEESMTAYIDSGLWSKASTVVAKMKEHAQDRRFITRSKIAAASLALARQNPSEARQEIAAVFKELKYASDKIPKSELATLRARAHLILAKINIEAFNKINIETESKKYAGVSGDNKKAIFSDIEHELLAVIAAGDKSYITEARYYYAEAAGHLAEFYSALYFKSLQVIPLARGAMLLREVKNFSDLSGQLHLENALLAQRKPADFGNDLWVIKSRERLNLEKISEDKIVNKRADFLPADAEGQSAETKGKEGSENEEIY